MKSVLVLLIKNSVLKSQHKISLLCKALNVNRSTYYNSLNREASFKASQHANNEEYISFLNQEFSPSEPNEVWISDFTYIEMSKGFRYLCVIMDLYSRKIIAWKLSNRMNSP